MAIINSSVQTPDHAILDFYNKQTYLGNEYSMPVGPIVLATTFETPITLIENVLGAKKSSFQSVRKFNSTAAVVFRFYFNATITATGVPVTPVNLRPASGFSAISKCFTSPTATSFGTLIDSYGNGLDTTVESDIMLILDPGTNLICTAQATTASTSVFSINIFYEI